MKIPRHLEKEAQAFDKRILERTASGHIPDLRRVRPCSWFYNNPWRHPDYARMVFGEYLSFAVKYLRPGSSVLEVGCGPGHMSLELARAGHHVTGLEISQECVNVARKMLKTNPYRKNFGSLRYERADFLSWKPQEKYDAVVFFLSFHHFSRPANVCRRAASLLKPGGRIILVEPARDFFSPANAAAAVLIRNLLAVNGQWHEKLVLQQDRKQLAEAVAECRREYAEARDSHEKPQSPHDNDSFAADMLKAVKTCFSELKYQPGFAFLPRLVGGIRMGSRAKNLKMAGFLKAFDGFCVEAGILQPGVFMFAGRLKSGKGKRK